MPAAVTPVAAGRAISTRARKSSRVDEPSTSTAGEDESETGTEVEISKRDELRALLIGRLFAIMREQRDKTEATIHPREVSVEEVVTENDLKLAPINDHILQMEQTSCGMTLEDMLKDAKYATYSATSMNINEVEKDIRKVGSNRTLEPIEVKIEDSDLLTTASSSVLPSASQETNVERAAKREAHVLSRIAELRRSGLWSNSRLPKCVEPERNKTHWDYVLEEVKWMAVDFHKETKTKMIVAKKLAQQIARIHREKEIEVEKAVERELREKKKLCANVAKMVRDFWQGVDKVVDIRAKEILEARVRKARNDHLMFVIGQVNEMSNIVQEGLVSSKSPSISSRADDDKEFDAGDESESDDERTIANAEKSLKTEEVKDEVDALNTEANAGMDDFLASLPPEYLAAYGLTKDDLDDIRKENNMTAKVEEINEEEEDMEVTGDGEKEDGEMEAGTSAEDETGKKDNEKSQDVSAEDGNGDGRGVLENVDYLKLKSVNSDERQEELAHIAEEALKFQPKGYTLETTQVKTPVPFLIKGQLREYQMVGLDWMVTLYEKNLNGILADEMGLGKTIQTISLLAHLACSESIWGPHLIVVPTSVILNWEMEFKKWCPALKILTYFGSAKDRAEKRKGWTKPNAFHVCITSYKTVTQDIRSFKQRAWQYLILDEAQNIKNWKSQRWQALLNVRARRRLLLTGTPLQNSLMELWSLMHFLMPTIFSSHDDFKDWFSTPMTGMMEGNIEYDGPLIQRLHKVLRPFILRRLKKEVEKQLPEKTEHVVKCALSKRQRYLYDDFMSRRSTKENLKSGNMMSVLNIVMQLRKCCNHPNLFEQRPVVSPFVVPKAQLDLPAKLFGIQEREDERVPAIFDLTQRVGVWQTSCETQKKPLIEEIENSEQVIDETNLRPPIVEGFRFSRSGYVSLPTHDNAPSDIQESNNSEEEVKTNGRIDIPSSSSSSQNPSQNRQIAHIRTRTVVNTAPLTIATERCGFNYTMANSGSRQILDQNARFSPPLKKPKLTGSALNFSDYVPDRVIERIDAARRLQLEILRRRCGKFSIPILSNELIGLLRSEIGIDSKTKRDEKVRILLNDYIEMLGNRFGMYVEPVLSDAWQCRPSSSGLPSYIRNNLVNVETCSRTLLLESQPNLDEQMILSRRLQFPELRLIEYDCGKLQTLAILLRQLYVHKHRCLIFTQMSKMLDVLQTFLSHHGYQYFRLDGSTGVEQRQAMMERFNADPKVFCFILSTRSGGVGINLTGADTVIFYDSDWNPTMDAQAQDRCHRIGQTRNVSIYRLISERTIEENILKKAMQKRRLGELAIDEAGFTPDFFKQSDNIRDLFDGEDVDIGAPADVPTNEKEMEKALAKCEDEADVNAAKLAKAEARVDVAEFDESAKLVTSNLAAPPGDEEADDKYMELISQLKPIERYAINFLEEEYKPEFEEEVKEAEAMIEQKREEWNEKMNESSQSEEDLKNIENDDNEIFGEDFYLGGPNLLDEILAIGFNDEYMPSWLPPSPPMSDNEFDLKMEDDTFDLIYEIDPMNEARLPSHIEELRRPLREKQKQNEDVMLGSNIINNKDKDLLHDFSKRLGFPSNSSNSANAAASSPGYSENSFSMDDSSQESKPDVFASRMAALSGQQTQQQKQAKKRTNKSHRSSEVDALRSFTPPPAIKEEIDYDGAEWSLVEDYTLLQAVQNEIANLHEFETPRKNEGMVFNWEYVAISVNKVTRFYRSARQCSIRYQMYVRPKESGVMYACDPVTKNRMKIEMGPAEVAHIRKGRAKTESQYQHEGGSIMDKKHLNRFKAVKTLADKKPAIFWRGPKELRKIEALENRLPLKHETKLREFDVKVGTLSDAEQISTIEEDKMVTNEPKKKVGIIDRSRANSPPPRRNILLLRPHAMPVSKNKELLPVRSNMTIEVPQLRDPQLHIAQQQQQLQQQQNQQPTRIPHVIPSMDHSSQSQIIQSQQHPQHPQRRIAQTHYIQQTQGNYVMVNSQNSEQTVQSVVQQQHLQQQQQQSQNVQQQQQQPQMQPQQRMTQYVTPQQIQSQRGLPMYTSSPQVVVTRGAPRVMRGGGTSRMYLQQTTAGGQSYVMTNHTQPVRVMPATQRVIHTQGTMGGQRRTQPPQPGTVASMIMPGRGGGVAQMRTIQRSYPAQRINLVVQNQQQQMRQAPGTTTHLITTTGPGGPTVKRQLVTGRPLPTLGRPVEQVVVHQQMQHQQQVQVQQQQSSSSQGLPPTSSSSSQSQPVAQVVLAPPTSSTNSHVQSQPPQRPPPPPQQQPQQQSNDTPSIPPPPPQS